MANKSIFKITSFLTFIASCLQNERNVKPCRSYSPLVMCPPIYLHHVSVCYEWKWNYLGWISSSATLMYHKPYDPKTTSCTLRCKIVCFFRLFCSIKDNIWVESMPECQQKESSTPRTEMPTFKMVTQVQTKTSLSSQGSTVLQSSADNMDLGHPPSTTSQKLFTQYQWLGTQEDDKRNPLAVYVAVPIVIVVCSVVLLVLVVLCRRKQWTQGIICHKQESVAAIDNRQIHVVTNNTYDPDVVSSTVVGALRVDDVENDYNTTNQQTALNSTDDFSNYDHLGTNNLSAVNSTYSSTLQVEARDTYSHTITTLPRHSDPPYDKAGNVALTQISEETETDTN